MSEQDINALRALVPQRSEAGLPAMSASMGVEADRAIAQVQGAMIMAKRFPRDEGRAVAKILETCDLLPVAEDSFYSFRRGGSVITGPSIDLLKICARYWGNIDFSVQEIERQQGQSVAMAVAIDLETNARASRQFIVPHIRDKNDEEGKASGQSLTSSRDIYELIANMGSRRQRACLEDLIPPHIVGAAFHRCQETLKAAATKEPLVERLKKLVPAFASVGVTEGMLVKHLGGRALGEMLEKEYITLRNIYRSIETGAQRVEEFFEKPSVADTVAAGKQQQPAKGKAGAQHEQQPTGEQQHKKVDDPAQKPTKDGLLKEIEGCKTMEQVNALGERIRTAGLSADDLKVVKKAAGARAGAIASQAVSGGSEDAPE